MTRPKKWTALYMTAAGLIALGLPLYATSGFTLAAGSGSGPPAPDMAPAVNTGEASGMIYTDVEGPAELGWNRTGVVVPLGGPGSFDEKHMESPVMVKPASGGYVMYYRGQNSQDEVGRIGRAVSPDGINWTKTGVVLEPTEIYEGNKVDPMTVLIENNVWKMWYGGGASGGCACYASSPDGINWTKYSANPVLLKTSGAWDNEGAGGQFKVARSGETYRMLYKGYGSAAEGWSFYGFAESRDGINWQKLGKAASPQPEIGEDVTYRNLGLLKVQDRYCLVYTTSGYLHLFLMSSLDGVQWQKCGAIFRQGLAPKGTDAKWATAPCFVVEDGRILMWYEGNSGGGHTRIHYAEINADAFYARCLDKVTPVTVVAGTAITNSSPLPNGEVGITYSQTLTASGGTAPYVWSIQAGALPAGLTLNPTTGAITGKPTMAGGPPGIVLRVTDSKGAMATKSLAITIVAAPAITTTSTLPSGKVGIAYSKTLAASGGTAPYIWSIQSGALPAGLSLNPSTGAITGKPGKAGGPATITFKVTDSLGGTATKAFSITIIL
jgi:hypothetical protein